MCEAIERIAKQREEEGIAKGMEGKTLENICNLMETLGLSVHAAMNALKIPLVEQSKYEAMIAKR